MSSFLIERKLELGFTCCATLTRYPSFGFKKPGLLKLYKRGTLKSTGPNFWEVVTTISTSDHCVAWSDGRWFFQNPSFICGIRTFFSRIACTSDET